MLGFAAGWCCGGSSITRRRRIRASRPRSARTSSPAATNGAAAGSPPLSYRTLLTLPQTWGIVVGKALTDPVWFFITDWFAIYLVSRGYRLEESLLAFWVPFLAADLGNFAGGGISSWLIARGWSVGWARKIVVLVGGLGMTLLAPTVWIDSYRRAGGVLCDLDVLLRRRLDDDPEPAGRRVPDRRRSPR